MGKESLLHRVADAISRTFSRPGGQENVSSDDPMEDFTKAERRMLKSALRREIVYGDYKGAGDLTTMIFKDRAERLKRHR